MAKQTGDLWHYSHGRADHLSVWDLFLDLRSSLFKGDVEVAEVSIASRVARQAGAWTGFLLRRIFKSRK